MRKLFTKTIFKTEERPLLQHLNSTKVIFKCMLKKFVSVNMWILAHRNFIAFDFPSGYFLSTKLTTQLSVSTMLLIRKSNQNEPSCQTLGSKLPCERLCTKNLWRIDRPPAEITKKRVQYPEKGGILSRVTWHLNTEWSRQNFSLQYQADKWWERKYQLGDYQLTWYQILPTSIIRIVWQSVRWITNEILRVKGLRVRGSTKYAFYACLSKKRYISFDKNWS